jgi:hypothetical protein
MRIESICTRALKRGSVRLVIQSQIPRDKHSTTITHL